MTTHAVTPEKNTPSKLAKGTQGMVASRDIYASQVGLDILKQGGNAIDAAIATAYALAVTNPTAGNIGGGGFMMIYLAKEKKIIAIDYREKAPLSATESLLLDAHGNYSYKRIRNLSIASGVPGTVAGLELARKKYATFSRKTLINPAYKLAKDGFNVHQTFHNTIQHSLDTLEQFPASQSIFLPNGIAPKIGSLFKQKDLAKSLKRIIKHGKDGFYKGKTAKKIANYMKKNQGLISLDDLSLYQALERTPIKGSYRGYSLYSMPPPSSGGIHLTQMLNILENVSLKDLSRADSIHVLTEAMKVAYADRSLYLGDPDFVNVPTKELISKAYAKTQFKKIKLSKARPSKDIYPGLDKAITERFETTHFSIIDKEGNMVANTYTLNAGFGNKRVVDGTGILLNNEMDDFSAKANTPNAFGLIGSKANKIEAQKRPLSSMTPTIILKDGQPFLATGARGGSRIITTVLQIITHIIDNDLNLEDATSMPRIHHQWKPDILFYEKGLSASVIQKLKAKGHHLKQVDFLALTNSVMKKDTLLYGFASNRSQDNLAIGY